MTLKLVPLRVAVHSIESSTRAEQTAKGIAGLRTGQEAITNYPGEAELSVQREERKHRG
jgi:hypothetical protein